MGSTPSRLVGDLTVHTCILAYTCNCWLIAQAEGCCRSCPGVVSAGLCQELGLVHREITLVTTDVQASSKLWEWCVHLNLASLLDAMHAPDSDFVAGCFIHAGQTEACAATAKLTQSSMGPSSGHHQRHGSPMLKGPVHVMLKRICSDNTLRVCMHAGTRG